MDGRDRVTSPDCIAGHAKPPPGRCQDLHHFEGGKPDEHAEQGRDVAILCEDGPWTEAHGFLSQWSGGSSPPPELVAGERGAFGDVVEVRLLAGEDRWGLGDDLEATEALRDVAGEA